MQIEFNFHKDTCGIMCSSGVVFNETISHEVYFV